MRKIFLFVSLFFMSVLASSFNGGKSIDADKTKILYQQEIFKVIEKYPDLQLADIYKSFYQDAFGPGHLLADSLESKRYFEFELSDSSKWGGPLYEKAGIGKNFVRVNLDLVRDSIIPKETFYEAFLKSLGKIAKPSDEQWENEWQMIDEIIKSNNLTFPNENEDRKIIEEKFRNKKYTMHHSHLFDSLYNFHYRIIYIDIFNDELLPLIKCC